MIRVTSEQMTTLAQPFRLAEINGIVAHLQRRHADRVGRLDEGALRRDVIEALDRATRRGIEGGAAARVFVTLCFTVSPWFDEHPKVVAVLERTEATALQRMEALGAELSDADWAELRRQRM